MYSNGELEGYELCMRFSAVELEGADDCAPLSLHRVPPDTPSFDQTDPLLIQGLELAVQIRAENEYNMKGNWSEAAILNTTDPPGTTVRTGRRSPDGVPHWVHGLIGALVLLTLAALVGVGILIANRRYCFHWCIKMSNTQGRGGP